MLWSGLSSYIVFQPKGSAVSSLLAFINVRYDIAQVEASAVELEINTARTCILFEVETGTHECTHIFDEHKHTGKPNGNGKVYPKRKLNKCGTITWH